MRSNGIAQYLHSVALAAAVIGLFASGAATQGHAQGRPIVDDWCSCMRASAATFQTLPWSYQRKERCRRFSETACSDDPSAKQATKKKS